MATAYRFEEVRDIIAEQESRRNRHSRSDEYDRLYNELNRKIAIINNLEKQIGCPLKVREQALKQCEFEGLYFETEDTDGFVRKGMYKCMLSYDGFTKRFYWNTGWNADIWLSSYKKTWWLRKDKSE